MANIESVINRADTLMAINLTYCEYQVYDKIAPSILTPSSPDQLE